MQVVAMILSSSPFLSCRSPAQRWVCFLGGAEHHSLIASGFLARSRRKAEQLLCLQGKLLWVSVAQGRLSAAHS